MNELIKKLEKQCWDHQTNHLNAEKFAELIVGKCAEYAEHAKDIDVDYKMYFKELLFGEFGVEE